MLSGLYAHLLNGFVLSILLTVGLVPIARDIRLVDLPDSRKRHSGEVPLCGGLAIFTAFILSGIGFEEAYGIPWTWEVGFCTLALLGLADDWWRLPVLPRLVVQVAAAMILVAGAGGAVLVLGHFGELGAWYLPAAPAVAVSVVFVVGMINSINMQDGLDGLAGASIAAALFWLALIAVHVGDGLIARHALVIMAAVLGFLIFNMRHPWRSSASVFLGDAGSMVLGGMLAAFVVHLSSGRVGVPFVALLWLVVVPAVDTLSLIVRRLAAGRSPMSSDRWHLHHLLLDLGVPPAMAALVVSAATAACGAVAYVGILFSVPDVYLALGLAVPLFAHSLFVLVALGHFRSIRVRLGSAARPVGPPGRQILGGKS